MASREVSFFGNLPGPSICRPVEGNVFPERSACFPTLWGGLSEYDPHFGDGIADFELILEKNRRNGPNGTYVRGRSHKTLATIIFRFINTMLGVERHLADPQWINRGENQLRHEGWLSD